MPLSQDDLAIAITDGTDTSIQATVTPGGSLQVSDFPYTALAGHGQLGKGTALAGSGSYLGIKTATVTTTATTVVSMSEGLVNLPSVFGSCTIASSNAADNRPTAGAGAHTCQVTYFKTDGTGPYLEDVILTGTTAVTLTGSNIYAVDRVSITKTGTAGATGATGNLTLTLGNNFLHHRLPAGVPFSRTAHIFIPASPVITILRSVTVSARGNSGYLFLRYSDVGDGGATGTAPEYPVLAPIRVLSTASPTHIKLDLPLIGRPKPPAGTLNTHNDQVLGRLKAYWQNDSATSATVWLDMEYVYVYP